MIDILVYKDHFAKQIVPARFLDQPLSPPGDANVEAALSAHAEEPVTRLSAKRFIAGVVDTYLGLPHAEEHQLKAALVRMQLKRLIAERELSQTAAAKLIHMKQPDLSKLLRDDFRLVRKRS